MTSLRPLKTFIVYSKEDRDLKTELEGHLRPFVDLGWLQLWSDREIKPGEVWDAAIKQNLLSADVFLMLVSVDFYNSEYIRGEEFKTAVARLENGDSMVIPIIVRHCAWKYYAVIKDLQVLPPGGAAVDDRDHWSSRHKAWSIVAEKIGERVEALRAELDEKISAETTQKRREKAEKEKEQQARAEAERLKKQEADWAKNAPDLVLIPGGTYPMGDTFGDPEAGSQEKPVHSVTLDDFYLSKHQLTFEEYDAFCADTKREKPADQGWGRGRRPVINVDWYDAVEYCNWRSRREGLSEAYRIDKNAKDPNNTYADDPKKWTVEWIASAKGYRLPTEAEWEYAARERGRKVRFGNGRDTADPSEINFDGSASYKKSYSVAGLYREKTVPVDELSANSLGLKQLSGNVWEWCWDWYAGDFYANSNGARNPQGPSAGSDRVLRGGSWFDFPQNARAAYRFDVRPSRRGNGAGFRLARTR